MTDLYPCPLAKDGLCPHGGLKTKSNNAFLNYCRLVLKWVGGRNGLKSCPHPKEQ